MIKELVFIIGTRPEAIKLAPVILMARSHGIVTFILSTGQHKDLVEPALDAFGLEPDYTLSIPEALQKSGLSLSHLTEHLLREINSTLAGLSGSIVVQGDTTSAFVGALLGFYLKYKVIHVEAGLRSGDKQEPFPEEMNRRLITQLADTHFAPTTRARDNLLAEGVRSENIHVVGNTVVDALNMIVDGSYQIKDHALKEFFKIPSSKLVMMTLHRRENWEIIPDICKALNKLFDYYEDIKLLIPAHPNRLLKDAMTNIFHKNKNVILVDALDYVDFINLLARCHFVVTDSGGVQEEAPYLGKPVLVVRNQTERQEGVETGVSKLIGVNPAGIVSEVKELLHNDYAYRGMQKMIFNSYGSGHASYMIINLLKYGVIKECQQ